MDEQVITTLREQEPSEFLIAALRLFIERDTYLLEVDANERSISHRLGLHLQSLLPDRDGEYMEWIKFYASSLQ
ncbi:hypothetical protein [Methylophaga sp.]|uniref:hypothetical protein n=1 Tax=Methylophaga sp. TaxID=2024840 RepID=UPI003A902F10